MYPEGNKNFPTNNKPFGNLQKTIAIYRGSSMDTCIIIIIVVSFISFKY